MRFQVLFDVPEEAAPQAIEERPHQDALWSDKDQIWVMYLDVVELAMLLEAQKELKLRWDPIAPVILLPLPVWLPVPT